MAVRFRAGFEAKMNGSLKVSKKLTNIFSQLSKIGSKTWQAFCQN
jgi:hypothetical protein